MWKWMVLVQHIIWYLFFTISGNPNLIMFLAANKADLEEKRKVGLEVVIVQHSHLLFSCCVPLDIWGEDSQPKLCPRPWECQGVPWFA